MNEQETWKNFKAGSERDFALLYRHYAPVLFRYGCKISSDRELVKDCLQQVFLTIWKQRETIATPTFIKSYLLKALRSEIFKKVSRTKTAESLPSDYHFKIEPCHESGLIEDETADANKRKISDMLAQLSDRQREVVFLKYYNNLSYSEISDIMGIEQESAYKLTYKAIERLQRLFVKVSACVLVFLSLWQ